MLEDEQTVKWLVPLGIAATVLLHRVARRYGDRRRREWFASVAVACGARAEHSSEFLSRFEAEVDERRCEVAYRYSGRIGWRLLVSIPLRGVSDIYNFVFDPTDDPGQTPVSVRNSGFRPREGWLNAELRDAVSHFYELAPRRTRLSVEAATLVCDTSDRLAGAVVRDRISRLVPVASALERTL